MNLKYFEPFLTYDVLLPGESSYTRSRQLTLQSEGLLLQSYLSQLGDNVAVLPDSQL